MINKIKKVLVYILLFSLAAILVFKENIGDLDELWQYSFASNILNGLVPYREFNIIVTPLFSFIAAIFLKLCGNQLIVMRLFNAFIFSGILIMAYKIFKYVKINEKYCLFFTFLLYLLFYYDLGVEYNYLVLLLTLFIILLEMKNVNKYYFNENLLIGIIAGCIIITKHTIGIPISILLIMIKLLFYKYNKENKKECAKSIMYRIIGILIPVLIFLVYLLITDSFSEFINYAILGISEFKNNVSYANLFFNKNILIRIFSFITPLSFTLIFQTDYMLKQGKKYNLIILLLYSIIMYIGIFPVANSGHFIIYGFIGIITVLYIGYEIFKTFKVDSKNKKRIKYFIEYFFLGVISIFLINEANGLIKMYAFSNINTNELNHYYGIAISKKGINAINTIDQYILDNKKIKKDTYILDSSAVLYMIPIDTYYKNYNMLNKGNLGFNGEEKIIEEIQNNKNKEYLLLKDIYQKNWQTPTNIINYVKNNKNKIGEIGAFDIYE